MRNFQYLVLLALVLAPVLAFAKNSQDVIVIPWPAKPPCNARDQLAKGRLSGFSARRTEPSFAKRYAPSLTLPVSEDQVFKIAKAQHLKIYLDGDGTDALCIHPPRGQPINDETIRKVYMLVDEGMLHSGATQIRYFAYADGNGMVTYIEPDYSYTGL
ncbi:hypothetical protein [Dyella sp. GSA-30]|uniref:hypothetical protein n=1 Tax=Dyella sp. GSA-30 TaxID=2994496 RepID=UPI00249282AA|nr:hypothetical protein [Dyella sp. GSA-30]BDU22190.1 hypothetical protein DYGSA30_36470 [Dyella sp. GSA-30]